MRVSSDFRADCISAIVIFLGVDFFEVDFFELAFGRAVFLRGERFLALADFLSVGLDAVAPDADVSDVCFLLSSPDD
tara:strand:- start:1021 stop:1251 length:231 start_codon:yes stop_codon:yes gene_type:complete